MTARLDGSLERRVPGFAVPLSVALVLGVALGITSLLLEHTPHPLSRISAMGGPWLVVAFAGGVLVGRGLPGTVTGALTLILATSAYYVIKPAVGSPINPPQYDTPLFWLAVALPAGAFGGLAGGLARGSGRPWIRVLAVALVAAVVIAEAWLVNLDAVALALLLTALAALLPLVALRDRRQRLAALLGALALAGPIWLIAQVALPLIVLLR